MTARARGESITVAAPAKLTLTLRVTGVRDDGYHLIDAEMVSLDLGDQLAFTRTQPGREPAVAFTGPTADGLVAGGDDLVTRALLAVGRLDVDVLVTKNIPQGGGLGGGSADAAAVFRWAGVDLTSAETVAVAASIGADVPFCLVGGRARVTGIGDELEPLPYVERIFTVATPDFGCDTAAVYRVWDDLGGPTSDGPNDLEPAALKHEPRLAAFRDGLGDATGETPVLAGSGSTWFVPGAHPGPGRTVVTTTPPH